ncbi:MAG: hypothetical protein LW825_04735 [Candidatus Jidaibacter sp.]|jgi:hypothetical protein|nr:hypothetical protein [Candidatus Jidaibacter sp.]
MSSMPPLFDYSSRTFTLMAIIFLVILLYLSHKDNQPIVDSNHIEQSKADNSEMTFKDKLMLLIFKEDAHKKIN